MSYRCGPFPGFIVIASPLKPQSDLVRWWRRRRRRRRRIPDIATTQTAFLLSSSPYYILYIYIYTSSYTFIARPISKNYFYFLFRLRPSSREYKEFADNTKARKGIGSVLLERVKCENSILFKAIQIRGLTNFRYSSAIVKPAKMRDFN